MKDKKKYPKVYYRIDAGYVWGSGLEEDKLQAISKELAEIFEPLGFTLKPSEISAASPEYHRGAEYLYCHPMSFSGYIIEENIPLIEAELKKAKTFSLRCVDKYETLYNYTPDELASELEKQRDAIRTKILEMFKTKRRNLYKPISPLYNIKTDIPCFDTTENENTQTDFVRGIFEKLVIDKTIIKGENPKVGTIYRTAS